MKLKILFLLICVLPAFLFAQDNSLLYSYKIPTYSYHSMKLYGQDFLDYLKINRLEERKKEERLNLKLGFDEILISQSPLTTRKMYGSILYNHNSQKDITRQWSNGRYKDVEHTTKTSSAVLGLMAYNSWYLNNERGIFFYGDPGILYTYDISNSKSTSFVDLPLGIGYGRTIGVKSLVQSYIISEEIGAGLSDTVLLELTDIIDRYNDGYFYAKYRDDAKIEYYKEIASVTKKPEAASKIEQILNSPVYKTSERFIGWQVKLGFNLTYLDQQTWEDNKVTNYSTATDLFFSAEYALPINFDKQLLATISYSKNMNEEDARLPKLNAEVKFSIDHNYHWSSSVLATYSKAFPKQGDSWTNIGLTAKTEYLFPNSFSVYATFGYTNQEFDETHFIKWSPLTNKILRTESIGFHLGFNYYLM